MPAARVCPTSGCPNFIRPPQERCTACQQALERRRGSSTARGYDSDHRRRRAAAMRRFRPGDLCAYCNEPMLSGQPLHYDHPTPLAVDREAKASRVVHASCNDSAGVRMRFGLEPRSGGPA